MKFTEIHNGGRLSLAEMPLLPGDQFRRAVLEAVLRGVRVACLTTIRSGDGRPALLAVMADQAGGMLSVAAGQLTGDRYAALTPECPQVHLFEREIWEHCGILPEGHPWLKPVRFPPARQGGHPVTCGVMDYFRMDGESVHEVAVGPVHAGIIEPGHFRFQCHGETVYHLEISLGYQHRGIERTFTGGPGPRTLHHMEVLAGDTTAGHAAAYCHVLESLAGTPVPARAQVLRGVAQELERVANHIGDLGALAGDVGFMPTQAYCGRIRGDVLNMTALLCGNRFSRGLTIPGGVDVDHDAKVIDALLARVDSVTADATSAVNLLWTAPSVMARFDGAGVFDAETCRRIGGVGVAARAAGVDMDVRRDFPYGIFRMAHIPGSLASSGDVRGRAMVRWQEVQRSLAFIREQLKSLPVGAIRTIPGPLTPESFTVTLVEGWRGEICHVAATDAAGRLATYKVVDPSFHNWFGLALALRNQQISDFPLCNKSFNLSYCGFDL